MVVVGGAGGNDNGGTEKELGKTNGQGRSEQQLQVNRAERTCRSQCPHCSAVRARMPQVGALGLKWESLTQIQEPNKCCPPKGRQGEPHGFSCLGFFFPVGLEDREGKRASQKWRSAHGWETGLKCKPVREA